MYAEAENAELSCVLNRLLKVNQANLTVAQLAHRLRVSVSTIYGWVDRDYIPFLMAGDLVRFDPSAIHDWMLAEADRKREKKRGLRAVRGKVTPAPGGCNRKGAIG